jgi:hypothetical protein
MITRRQNPYTADEAGDLISDHDGSSFTSSASPLSPGPGEASSASNSVKTLNSSKPRKSSLKGSLGEDWTTRSRHQYWPAEGWTSATSVHSRLEGRSSTKAGRVEWKGLPWQMDDKEGDADESPTIEISRKKGEGSSKRTRSGRVVKTVERDYPRGLVKKRTRSDPLPSKRRATTPPSASHLGIGNPERPQSAMKHRSANQYSLGSKGDPMIVVISHSQMPEADASPGQSPFVTASASVKSRPGNQKWSAPALQLTKPAAEGEAQDPDAFSPLTLRTQAQLIKYELKARPSLPKSSFYERYKEEEGSPTPESRRRDSTSVS